MDFVSSRRHFLGLLASTATFSVAGCLGGDGVPLIIENTDAESHAVSVSISGDFDSRSTTETVESDAVVRLDDFIPRLDYPHDVTFSVDVDGSIVAGQTHEVGNTRIIVSDATTADIVLVNPTTTMP